MISYRNPQNTVDNVRKNLYILYFRNMERNLNSHSHKRELADITNEDGIEPLCKYRKLGPSEDIVNGTSESEKESLKPDIQGKNATSFTINAILGGSDSLKKPDKPESSKTGNSSVPMGYPHQPNAYNIDPTRLGLTSCLQQGFPTKYGAHFGRGVVQDTFHRTSFPYQTATHSSTVPLMPYQNMCQFPITNFVQAGFNASYIAEQQRHLYYPHWQMQLAPLPQPLYQPIQRPSAEQDTEKEAVKTSANDITVKRKRTIFTASQLARLEAEFSKSHYLTGADRSKLATDLSLDDSQVKNWFQNKRIKWRNEKYPKQEQNASKMEILKMKGQEDTDGANK